MTTPNAPVWLQPSAAGMLSNHQGSNLTTDAIAFKSRYTNPNAADRPGQIRVTASRTVISGVPTATPQLIWDTGFIGSPATTTIPYTATVAGVVCPVGPNSVATHAVQVTAGIIGFGGADSILFFFSGRVYVLIADQHVTDTTHVGVIYSAPISGTTVGAWRLETAPTSASPSEVCAPGALTIIGTYAYVLTNRTIWSAQIQGDGTFGGWTDQIFANPDFVNFSSVWPSTPVMMAGYDAAGWSSEVTVDSGKSLGWLYVFDNAGGVTRYGLDGVDGDIEDNTFTLSNVVQPSLPAAVNYGAVHVDDSGYIYVIGGESGGGTPSSACYYAPVNVSTDGRITASWSTSSKPLPNARTRAAYAAWYVSGSPRLSGGQPATIMIAGGQQVSAGAAQTTIYTIGADQLRGATGGSWVTTTHPLAQAMALGGAHVVNTGPSSDPPYPTANFKVYVVLLGGGVTLPELAVTDDSLAVTQGNSTPLSAGVLGTGGAVVVNPDGSVDVSFLFNGFGPVSWLTAGFGDGDQVLMTVQFTDVNGGSPGPVATTVVKVGQPPTISNVTPSGAASSGAPTIGFNYSPGLGGAPEAFWRIELLKPYTAVVLGDGPTAYYRLDDTGATAADFTGNGNTGTITNVLESQPGALAADTDTAMVFNGASSVVDLGTSLTPVFQARDFSVEYWVNPASATNYVFSCGLTGSAGLDAFLHVGFDNLGHAKLGFFGDDLIGNAVLQAGSWYHVVVTWAAATRQRSIYVNGQLDVSATSAGSLSVPNGSDAQIGRVSFGPGNGPFFYNGTVDELAVYGKALTAAQVLTHYQTGLASQAAPTLADSGIQPNTLNTFTPVLAPRLTSGIVYGHLITTASTDVPMTASDTNEAQVVTTFAPTFTRPAAPITPVASVDATLMAVNLAVLAPQPLSAPNVNDGGQFRPVVMMGRQQGGQVTAPPSIRNSGGTGGGFGNPIQTFPRKRPNPVSRRSVWLAAPGPLHAGSPGFSLAFTYVAADGSESPPSPGANPVILAATGNQLNVAAITGVPSWVVALNFYFVGVVPAGDTAGFVTQQPVSGGTCAAFSIRTEGNGLAPPSAPTIRVYHRRSGTTLWTILVDGVTSTPGMQQTVGPLMDQIAWGASYDFSVSLISPAAESAMVSAGSVTLPQQPASGSVAGMLHVAGNGATYHVSLPLTGGPKLSTHLDAVAAEVFGLAAPLLRYGVLDYHVLEAKSRVLDAPTMAAFQAVRQQAQQQGATLYWRDAAGHVLTMGFQPDYALTHLPQAYLAMRELDIKLTEIPNTYQPSTTRGAVAGVFQQVNGTLVPLDPSEVAA